MILVDLRIQRDDWSDRLAHELIQYHLTGVNLSPPASGPEIELTFANVHERCIVDHLRGQGIFVLASRTRRELRGTSPARRALVKILATFPEAEIEWVDFQPERGVDLRTVETGELVKTYPLPAGHWVAVKLAHLPHPLAIWKATGAIYREDENGAVEDDPILTID